MLLVWLPLSGLLQGAHPLRPPPRVLVLLAVPHDLPGRADGQVSIGGLAGEVVLHFPDERLVDEGGAAAAAPVVPFFAGGGLDRDGLALAIKPCDYKRVAIFGFLR